MAPMITSFRALWIILLAKPYTKQLIVSMFRDSKRLAFRESLKLAPVPSSSRLL